MDNRFQASGKKSPSAVKIHAAPKKIIKRSYSGQTSSTADANFI